jgi:HAD superfamily hydrolase (TIGR01509 family)
MTDTSSRPSPSIAVFDVGNVLIEWDPRHVYRDLFPGEPDAMSWFLDTICTAAWNLAQDAGRTWAEAVGQLVAVYPEWRAEIEAYDKRWQDMVPGVIDGSVAILDRLRQDGVRLFAITNFSSEKFVESARRFPFFDWFDGIVVSGDDRLLKPDLPIFRLLCARYGMAAADCVFIDDNAANVAGAQAAGMTAIHFSDPDALERALRGLGFLHGGATPVSAAASRSTSG